MTFILRWILKWFLSGFTACFGLVNAISSDCFNNNIVISILKAFQTVGLPLVAFAILILLVKSVLSVSDGENVNWLDIGKRCIFGIIVYRYGVELMKLLYLVLLNVCQEVLAAIAGVDMSSSLNLSDFMLSPSLLVIVLIVLIFYYMFKIFISLTERFWQMMVLLCMMYVYLTNYVAGDDESLTLWFKQCIAIGLTQIFQSIVTSAGFAIFATSGGMGNWLLTVGALAAASKVEQLLDRYGLSVGGKIGGAARNAMSTAFYSNSLLKMIKRS